jgi:hypothetical protein
MSKEHFWPEWLAPFLAEPSEDGHITEFHAAEGPMPRRPELRSRTERQGSVTTKKLRVVCKACNNGWMSKIEASAKPVVLGLLDRSSQLLDPGSLDALAIWLTLKVIVAEHAEVATALTPPADRHLFYVERKIPWYFRLFVGYHSLETESAYFRHATTVSQRFSGPKPPLEQGIDRNIQAITFLVGPLLFFAVGIREVRLNQVMLDPGPRMMCIWPREHSRLTHFGLLEPLNQAAVSSTTWKLTELMERPGVGYGGPVPPTDRQ